MKKHLFFFIYHVTTYYMYTWVYVGARVCVCVCVCMCVCVHVAQLTCTAFDSLVRYALLGASSKKKVTQEPLGRCVWFFLLGEV